jgi:hypothetical protein
MYARFKRSKHSFCSSVARGKTVRKAGSQPATSSWPVLSAAAGPGKEKGISGERDGVRYSFQAHPVLAYLGALPQEASKYAESERRRGGSGANTPPCHLRSCRRYLRPTPSARVVVRGRTEERTAHKRTPPAEFFDGYPLHLRSPPPPMAGLFFIPAMSRLLARAGRGRPQRPRRPSGPHVTPLP